MKNILSFITHFKKTIICYLMSHCSDVISIAGGSTWLSEGKNLQDSMVAKACVSQTT